MYYIYVHIPGKAFERRVLFSSSLEEFEEMVPGSSRLGGWGSSISFDENSSLSAEGSQTL